MKKGYLITGLLTAIPLWITWLVIGFIFGLVTDSGMPLANWVTEQIRMDHPTIAALIQNIVFKSLVSALLIIMLLYFLGWLTTRVIGNRLIKGVEKILDRIPMVRTVYGGSKKIIESFQTKSEKQQPVVLINYPSPEMKTIGLLTRTIIDKDTSEKLAAVYVPTTPNPTSGFLEIVPYNDIILTNWTVNEALSFIVSGGVVGPDSINYSKSDYLKSDDGDDENIR
jgi:uncharacterized membrane protein